MRKKAAKHRKEMSKTAEPLLTVNVVEVVGDVPKQVVSYACGEKGAEAAKALFQRLVRENEPQDKPLTDKQMADILNDGHYADPYGSYSVSLVYSNAD